jgi:hypothetical protein
MDVEEAETLEINLNKHNTIEEQSAPISNNAIDVIFDAGYASVPLLQMQLKIGQDFAEQILAKMEDMKIIGSSGVSGTRALLMDAEEFRSRDIDISQFETSLQFSKHYDNMDGREFENFCADLLKNNGFENVEVTSGSGDYGVDIFAEKDGITYAIQCKCYSSNIGNKAVQEIFSGKNYYKKHIAVVLTNQYFTSAAKKTAEHTGVVLWDRDYLDKLNWKH